MNSAIAASSPFWSGHCTSNIALFFTCARLSLLKNPVQYFLLVIPSEARFFSSGRRGICRCNFTAFPTSVQTTLPRYPPTPDSSSQSNPVSFPAAKTSPASPAQLLRECQQMLRNTPTGLSGNGTRSIEPQPVCARTSGGTGCWLRRCKDFLTGSTKYTQSTLSLCSRVTPRAFHLVRIKKSRRAFFSPTSAAVTAFLASPVPPTVSFRASPGRSYRDDEESAGAFAFQLRVLLSERHPTRTSGS